jgi:Flp pilus assembly protein protease CpaA
VSVLQNCVFGFFAISISITDVKTHKIRNRTLLLFTGTIVVSSFIPSSAELNPFAGIQFLTIFSLLHVLSNSVRESGGIGFGDVKLVAVLAFAFFDSGVQSLAIFFIALWLALLAHTSLYFLIYRKFPRRIALAPDIFLASGLYLYAPIALLLPQ